MPTAAEQLTALIGMMKENPADDPIQNVTGILYGDSGGGKTYTAAELAQRIRGLYGGKILYLDAVNAWRTLKNHPELLEGLVHLKYTGKSMIDTLNLALEHNRPEVAEFKVIVLDEVSTMLDLDCDLVLAAGAADDQAKDPDTLTQPDMGKATQRMRRTMNMLLKQNVSVILVSHERQDEDKQLGYATARPALMPKFARGLKESLDFVVRFTATQKARDGELQYERIVQCHPTTLVVAKTRVGGLPLKTDPHQFVDQVVKWLKGEVGDSKVDVVINDNIVPAGKSDEGSDDFSTFVVD